jgi:hypothetical protein
MNIVRGICALIFLVGLVACGGGGHSGPPTPTPTPVPTSITVSPTSATVALNAQQAFTATANGTSVAVNWSVNGVQGGNSTVGMIDANGNFNAPASFPSPNLETVTATLKSDNTKMSNSSVTVVFPNDNHTGEATPIKLGTSGGNSKDSVTNGTTITCCSGTLGSLVKQGTTLFILSNNHVLDKSSFGTIGDPVTQPGLVDNRCNPGTLVANLSQAASLKPSPCSGVCTGPAPSNVDAAIAQIGAGAVDTTGSILDLGTATSSSIAAAPPSATLANLTNVLMSGEGVAKSGRSTGLTCSTLSSLSTFVSVDYDSSCGGAKAFTATFSNQVIVNGGSFSASGDSGSLVVTSDTARPVGLLFAGNSTSTTANPISDVLNAFTGGTLSVVGVADHTVSCDPTATAPAANPGPGASSAKLSTQERQRVARIREKQAFVLLADPAITAVDIGASQDNPGEGALLIRLSGATKNPIPAVIDGVRTMVALNQQAVHPRMPVLDPREIDRSIAIKDKHADALMSQPGIQGVGVGRSDDNPAETAIVIYVLSGQPRPPIPQLLDGVRTKIIEGDRFRAFGWGKETKPMAECAKQ